MKNIARAIFHKYRQFLHKYRQFLHKYRQFLNYSKWHYFLRTVPKTSSGPKILFGPGFNIGITFTHHDLIIAGLLKNKGAEIHYPYGRQGFISNYSFWGGEWGENKSKSTNNLIYAENRAYSYFKNIAITHNIAEYIGQSDLAGIKSEIESLSLEDMLEYEYNGIEIGHDAMNTVRNLFMVDSIHLVPDCKDELKESLHDCMVYLLFFEKIIENVEPDTIFSHDGFYMPWSLLAKIADKHYIKFYNYYIGLYPDTWIYTNRKPAMEFDKMDRLWDTKKNKVLNQNEQKKLHDILSKRERGMIGKISLEKYHGEDANVLFKKINSKPFAVFYSNIFWDLSALDKEFLYPTIKDSLISLVRWFSKNPNYHLIIKAHPAEKHSQIPETKYSVNKVLNHFIGDLPTNVHYLSPKTSTSAYDLYRNSNVSISWTGTSGIESVIYGTPSIVIANAHYRGKGFTEDPSDKDELSMLLEKFLSKKVDIDDRKVNIAKKYFYLFQCELSKNVGIPTMRYGGKPTGLKFLSAEAYLKNEYLNETINKIINKEIL